MLSVKKWGKPLYCIADLPGKSIVFIKCIGTKCIFWKGSETNITEANNGMLGCKYREVRYGLFDKKT